MSKSRTPPPIISEALSLGIVLIIKEKSMNEEKLETFKELVRGKAEEATGEMLKSLREDNLEKDEAYESYGYMRGVRDLIYTLNLQKNGESKTNDDLHIALIYLQSLTK